MPSSAQLTPDWTAIGSVLSESQAMLDSVAKRLAGDDAIADIGGALDRDFRNAFDALDGLYGYLTLFRPSSHATYDLLAFVRRIGAHRAPVNDSLMPSGTTTFTGDTEQIAQCLKMAWSSISRGRPEWMSTRVYLEGARSRIEISTSSDTERFARFTIAAPLGLSADEFGQCWAAATRGGRIRIGSGVLEAFVSGDAQLPLPDPRAASVLPTVRTMVRALSPWRGAIGHYEDGLVGTDDTRHIYQATAEQALEAIQRLRLIIPGGPMP